MEFKIVLEKLLTNFERLNIRYALMGGFALGLWGYGRATADVDFLAHRDDMDKVDAVMKGLGYECRYKSDNVSQYLSPLKIFGEVDFIHAFRETSLAMLRNAEEKTIFNGDLKIRVLKPESLIAFKLQAVKNNPSRTSVDLQDIKKLAEINKRNMMNPASGSKDVLDKAITEDMKAMESRRRNPFMKNGKADVDAYVQFVCVFNEFINHNPKPFSQMIDRDMIL